MIVRLKDGTYCLSSLDGEFVRYAEKKEGDELLRNAIGKEKADRSIRENREVWVC